MVRKLYSVDFSKGVTLKKVKKAILVCFKEAHKEVIQDFLSGDKFNSKEEKEEMENFYTENLVRGKFEEVGVDFDNPTKKGLIKGIGNLANYARKFRSPKLIHKHYNEILSLINQIK
jgi:hypothetical protein